MSDQHREVLAVLAEVCEPARDVRLGQLIDHLGFMGEVFVGKGFGVIEDDELLAVLYRHRAELQARLNANPPTELILNPAAASVSGSSTLPETVPASS